MKAPSMLLVIALALMAGCTTRTAQTPDGKVIYKSTRVGNKEAIKRVEYRGADGVVFILEGYSSDQVEGMGIIAEAAARNHAGVLFLLGACAFKAFL